MFVVSLLSTSALGEIFSWGSDDEEYSELTSEPAGVVLFSGRPGEEQNLINDDNCRELMMLVQELPRDERRTRNKNFL